MKICMLSGSSFENNYSSYHLMRDLIDGLLENGDEVRLIQKCYEQPGYLPQELKGRAGLKTNDIPFTAAEKTNLVKRMLADIKYYMKSAKAIRKYRDSDVFFLQSNNAPWLPIGLIKLLTRKPIVYNVQDIFPQNAIFTGMLSEKSIVCKTLKLLQRWSLKHSDAIITISEDMKDTLIEAGAAPDKVTVAHNWANEVHGENKLRKPDDGKYHVVYAGNIGRMQNVEVIIRAAALLTEQKEIQFDIYGNGVMKDQCKALTAELHADNVRFCDPVPADLAHELYENADLNVIPLAPGIIKTALPSKTAVCLNCGKPVVFCFDERSKAAAMLKGAGCSVADARSADALANAVQKTYHDRLHVLKYGQYGTIISEFNRKKSVSKYSDTLRKAQARTRLRREIL